MALFKKFYKNLSTVTIEQTLSIVFSRKPFGLLQFISFISVNNDTGGKYLKSIVYFTNVFQEVVSTKVQVVITRNQNDFWEVLQNT